MAGFKATKRPGGEPEEANGHSAGRIVTLLRDLKDDTLNLVKQEIALVKTEMTEKASRFSRNAMYGVIGGVTLFMGIWFILGAVTVGIYMALVNADVAVLTSMWLAPFIVGVIVAVIGAITLGKGISTMKNETLRPERTMQNLKEDREWVRKKVS